MNYNILPIVLFSILLTVVVSQQSAHGLFIAGSDLLDWNANKKLTWDDFQGNAYSASHPSFHATDYGAVTYSYLSWDFSWEFANSQGCHYRYTNILATAHFDRSKSWVNEGYETDYILKHEQNHFDITQIAADSFNERVRTELMGKEFPCPGGRNDPNSVNNHARNQVQGVFSDVNRSVNIQMNEDYDYETDGGRDSSVQSEWNNKIESLLDVDRRGHAVNQFGFINQIIHNIQILFGSLFG